MTILVTGASGFIGSYIVEEGLRQGHGMWAGMRGSSSREYLKDERIRFAELDLGNSEKLRFQLASYCPELPGGKWDVVVHAAGATKCLNEETFYKVNTDGTKNLIEALRATGMTPKRFVFVSSLSIYGAIREEPVHPGEKWIYSPILDSDTPQPNTAYGRSKLEAEAYLKTVKDFPYTILRPTGVYGPREKDYFLMAESIAGHVDFAVGYKPQEITFVYVMDVVQAVFRCMDAPDAVGKAYFLSDGHIYNSRRFSDLLQEEMGVKYVLHIKAPLWFLRIVCSVSTHLSKLTRKLSALNNDKYHILKQRNWQCDIEPARRDFGYAPEWPLERGVKVAVAWYKQAGWLK